MAEPAARAGALLSSRPRATLWGRHAAHADHRSRQRRQGGRRPRAPACACCARDPVLVVPTSADARTTPASSPRAGLVFGAEVVDVRASDARHRARCRGAGPAARAARPRRGSCAATVARRRSCDALAAVRARRRGSPEALGDAVRRARGGRSSRPARFARGRARVAGRRPRTPTSSRRCTRPTTRRLEALGAVDADGLRARGAGRAARATRRWDGRPLFLYGFDELHAAAAGRGGDARPPRRRRGVRSRCRTSRAARRWRAAPATVELLKPLAREHVALLEARSEHYAEARARRAAPPRARAVRGRRRAPRPAQRRRAAARGGRRAGGGRARRRVGARAVARRHGARGHRGARPRRRGDASCSRRSSPTTASRSPANAASPLAAHAPRRGPAGASPARRSAGHGAGRRDVAAHAGQARRRRTPPTALRGRGRPRTRRGPRAEARRLWERARRAAAARARRPCRGCEGAAGVPRRAARRGRGDLDGPHVRRGAVLGARGRGRRAGRRARCAAPSGELTRLAEADPGARREPGELLEALAAVEVREGRRRRRARPASCSRTRWTSARGASAPSFVCGLQDGELPRRPQPEPFLDDARAPRAGDGLGPRAPAPRGHAGPRALAVLRVRLAARGGAVPLVPHVGRGGRAAAAVAVRRRRPRAVHGRAVGRPRPAAARRGHLAAGRGADAARAAPRAGLRRAAAGSARRSAAPSAPAGARRAARAATASPRAAWRRSRPAACAGSSSSCCGPMPSIRTRSRCGAARRSTRVLERTLRGLKTRTGSARLTPRDAAMPRSRELHDAIAEVGPPRGGGAARVPRRARWRSTSSATCATRRSRARATSPSSSSGASAATMTSARAAARRRRGQRARGPGRHRAGRRGRAATTRAGPSTPARAGREDGRLQAALYALAVRERLGLDVAARSTSRSAAPTSARAGWCATTFRAATSTATSSTSETLDGAAWTRRARRRGQGRRRAARRPHPPVPRALRLRRRLRLPGDLPLMKRLRLALLPHVFLSGRRPARIATAYFTARVHRAA